MLKFGMGMPLLTMGVYGSAMILLVLALRLLFKKALPKAVMPLLWALVLVRLVVPFSVANAYGWQSPVRGVGLGATAVSEADAADHSGPENTVPQPAAVQQVTTASAHETGDVSEGAAAGGLLDGFALLLVLNAAGILAAAGLLLARRYRYGKTLRDCQPIEENPAVTAILAANGLPWVPVATCDAISGPLVCGVLRPRIYLPTRMDFSNTTLLRHVLTHECTHIRRGDNALKTVLLAALCLHWYNPLVWGMCRWLPADIESACDAAALRKLTPADPDARKNYAASLLCMAVHSTKPGLLYSAFSKSEVERRIRGVLNYKKAGAAALLACFALCGGTVVFAASGQAPFQQELCSRVTADTSRWETDVNLAWDAPLGQDAPARGKAAALQILRQNPEAPRSELADKTAAALAEEFSVNRNTFAVEITLKSETAALEQEYAAFGLTKAETENGFEQYFYEGEPVRVLMDRMCRSISSTGGDAAVDVTVQRDDYGKITGLDLLRAGDPGFENRVIDW